MSRYGTVGEVAATGFRRLDNKDEFDSTSKEASDLVQYIRNQVGELGKLQKQRNTDSNALLRRLEGIVNDCGLKAAQASTLLTQLQELVKSSGDRGQEISAKRISHSLQSAVDDLKRKVDEIKSSIDAEGDPAPKRPKERGFLDSTDGRGDSSRHWSGAKQPSPPRDNMLGGDPLSTPGERQQVQYDEHSRAAIEERKRVMLQLEQDINNMNEVMRDIAVMVFEQGEDIGRIEDAVETAATRVLDGNKQLKTAVGYKKCSRKLTCCIVIILLVVLLIILIAIIIGVCVLTTACKK